MLMNLQKYIKDNLKGQGWMLGWEGTLAVARFGDVIPTAGDASVPSPLRIIPHDFPSFTSGVPQALQVARKMYPAR
jgi:hypothetical protein